MKMINDEVVDFIFAVNHFANRNKISESNALGIPELAHWCREYERRLSPPFLLNDIALINGKMVFPTKYLFFALYEHSRDRDSRRISLQAETGEDGRFH